MKLFLFLVCTLLVTNIYAQNNYVPIDKKRVQELINDSSANTYYPKLLNRLKSYDTTLTLIDYRLIYYGFALQPGYSPYGDSKAKEINTAFDKANYEEVIKLCNEVISNNPVSLRSYYYKLVALSKLNSDSTQFANLKTQYFQFLNAISSSGDGLTCNTGFKVISVSDEYDFMYRYLEISKVGNQTLAIPCDKMSISPSKYFPKGIVYFDVSDSLFWAEKAFK